MLTKIKLNLSLLLVISLLGSCAAPRAIVAKKSRPPVVQPVAPAVSPLRLSRWEEIPGWRSDNFTEVWPAFLVDCPRPTVINAACAQASNINPTDNEGVRQFFETYFLPYQLLNAVGSGEGLITGYYEPLLSGSRTSSSRFRYPLYQKPHASLANFSREEIDGPQGLLQGYELVWVDDAVDLFFLHIQGSGRVAMDTGETMRVGYAGQNGHPYVAIGKLLIESGDLTREEVNMPSIKAWLRNNPEKSTPLLNRNPSYIFFRELPASIAGPLGAQGVPLTAGRSIAIDPEFVPLGAPVFLNTTWPGTLNSLQRLTIAQDKGGAIKGAVRADFFWGFGPEAEFYAGRMKEVGNIWVLLPH